MNEAASTLGKLAKGKPKHYSARYKKILTERLINARAKKKEKRLAKDSAPGILPHIT